MVQVPSLPPVPESWICPTNRTRVEKIRTRSSIHSSSLAVEIQIWRGVQERVSQVAPFLLLDQAPCAVLSEGKQYWIRDAHTTCDRYPYSNVQTGGKGSGVIRGQLNVIPIENSFLYVVPLYLKAEGTNFPQLK